VTDHRAPHYAGSGALTISAEQAKELRRLLFVGDAAGAERLLFPTRDRTKDQPALYMAAVEACVTNHTDGFCHPSRHQACTRCWPAAEAVMRATGLSAQAVAWVFAHCRSIEEAAKPKAKT
jgi:hypothetical protein